MKPHIFFTPTEKGEIFYFKKACPEIGIPEKPYGLVNIFLAPTSEGHITVTNFGQNFMSYFKKYTIDQIAILMLLGYVTPYEK